MAQETTKLRDHHNPRAILPVAGSLMALLLSGCATYRAAPLDPAEILSELRAISIERVIPPGPGSASSPDAGNHAAQATAPAGAATVSSFDPSDGLTVDEAVSVALQLNPTLRAQRAEAGVVGAQLIEAGLLPDPTFGWELAEGAFEFLLPLLRPGERTARVDEAEARTQEVRWSILKNEWALKREVHLAFIEALAAKERRQLTEQLLLVVDRTHEFFLAARRAQAVPALQETTAAIQASEVRLEKTRLSAEERRARQALNALLGLPPESALTLQVPNDLFRENTDSNSPNETDADSLTDTAIRRRPDLGALLAGYDRAEQQLRLAIAQQWPELAIGTTTELTLPLFGRLNRPAIQTAWEQRERLALKVEAGVHDLRAEVHDAATALDSSARQLDFLLTEVAPRLDESLALAQDAFDARQVNAGEILIAQSQVLDARVRLLEARIEYARTLATVQWVTGDDTFGVRP